tara:strand:- start:305 stop:487 length:183 start_codon:yes stop_codon:yes gene_type:complete
MVRRALKESFTLVFSSLSVIDFNKGLAIYLNDSMGSMDTVDSIDFYIENSKVLVDESMSL